MKIIALAIVVLIALAASEQQDQVAALSLVTRRLSPPGVPGARPPLPSWRGSFAEKQVSLLFGTGSTGRFLQKLSERKHVPIKIRETSPPKKTHDFECHIPRRILIEFRV
jgi:hypothetical protein